MISCFAVPWLAYDIKPKAPDSAFTAKLRPDILGVSPEATADSARAAFEALFKGRTDAKSDIQQQKFGNTGIGFVTSLNYSLPSGPKQTAK